MTKNRPILQAIIQAGYNNIHQFWSAGCFKNSYSVISRLINGLDKPVNAYGVIREAAIDLADRLNMLPEDLWDHSELYPMEVLFSDAGFVEHDIRGLMYSKRMSHLLDPVEFFSRQEVVGYMRDIVQMLTESQKKVLTAMYGLDGEEPCERRDLEHRFKGELAYGTAFHHLVRAKRRIRYIISQNHRGALLNE